MATLTTDLVGRVKRLPLKPSSTSALLPMFEAVMDELGSVDDAALHRIEAILNNNVPHFIRSREEIYRCLVEMMRDELG